MVSAQEKLMFAIELTHLPLDKKYINFYLGKSIWKYHLENVSHIVSASIW